MSYGLNKVMLIGHLGADPELRYTEGNVPVANFNIATNESYKDQNGNLVDRTEWHRIVAWRKLAEVLAEYLKKGSKVYIEGKLQTRSWDDKDGNKRYMTEVVVNDFMFLDSRGAGNSGSPAPGGDIPPPAPESDKKEDEDLPF
ncbi:MAG: single-stranded DNA-binding protein [Bacteroidetes bacterium]|nr:single-stranded DNA-binding protein [Bacteroidota bacterium]